MPKTVHLEFYAALREAAGLARETVESAAQTATQLYDEAAARHGFVFDRESLRVARNNVLETWSARIEDGDIVAFLSPYAGG